MYVFNVLEKLVDESCLKTVKIAWNELLQTLCYYVMWCEILIFFMYLPTTKVKKYLGIYWQDILRWIVLGATKDQRNETCQGDWWVFTGAAYSTYHFSQELLNTTIIIDLQLLPSENVGLLNLLYSNALTPSSKCHLLS